MASNSKDLDLTLGEFTQRLEIGRLEELHLFNKLPQYIAQINNLINALQQGALEPKTIDAEPPLSEFKSSFKSLENAINYLLMLNQIWSDAERKTMAVQCCQQLEWVKQKAQALSPINDTPLDNNLCQKSWQDWRPLLLTFKISVQHMSNLLPWTSLVAYKDSLLEHLYLVGSRIKKRKAILESDSIRNFVIELFNNYFQANKLQALSSIQWIVDNIDLNIAAITSINKLKQLKANLEQQYRSENNAALIKALQEHHFNARTSCYPSEFMRSLDCRYIPEQIGEDMRDTIYAAIHERVTDIKEVRDLLANTSWQQAIKEHKISVYDLAFINAPLSKKCLNVITSANPSTKKLTTVMHSAITNKALSLVEFFFNNHQDFYLANDNILRQLAKMPYVYQNTSRYFQRVFLAIFNAKPDLITNIVNGESAFDCLLENYNLEKITTDNFQPEQSFFYQLFNSLAATRKLPDAAIHQLQEYNDRYNKQYQELLALVYPPQPIVFTSNSASASALQITVTPPTP